MTGETPETGPLLNACALAAAGGFFDLLHQFLGFLQAESGILAREFDGFDFLLSQDKFSDMAELLRRAEFLAPWACR